MDTNRELLLIRGLPGSGKTPMAKKRGIKVRIVEATGNWPNVHGVPSDAIERMRARWEHIEGD